jgi:hypothetical protein
MSASTDEMVAEVLAEAVADAKGDADDLAWVFELSAWRVARQQARRANRNLLQYAGSFAALIGIGAGTGGVFAMAKAVNKSTETQIVPGWALMAALVVASIFAVGLLLLIWSAYRTRRTAERHADEHLRHLISIRPHHFLPKPKKK